ncbi:MAG: DUF6790 family protein, partial [Sphingomicrobium sp.]
MQQIIAALLSNFTLTFLILGVLATAISMARHRGGGDTRVRKGHSRRGHFAEAAIAFYCLFAIGLTFFTNFVMHVFFGTVAASYIGWAQSPFQAEVGWASLGFAAVGLLAYREGFEMRLAAVLGPACFLLGAAIGHVVQMVTAHNFAPGNAGIIFWTDIIVP